MTGSDYAHVPELGQRAVRPFQAFFSKYTISKIAVYREAPIKNVTKSIFFCFAGKPSVGQMQVGCR
jgi:hypothetical protein